MNSRKEYLKLYRDTNRNELNEKFRVYYQENKENIIKKVAEYKKNNKDKIKEYNNQNYHCDICKCDMNYSFKSRHFKTQKHINNMP